MQIEIIGNDVRLGVAAETLCLSETGVADKLYLLPIPTTKDKKHVTDSSVTLASLSALSKEGCVFAGYAIPEPIAGELAAGGAGVLDLAECEDFLEENARLTAEGALGRLLTTSARALSDMRVGIIGYGRIGRYLLRYLMLLGSKIRLYTRREAVRREVGMFEIESELMCENADFANLDLLINTSPAPFPRKANGLGYSTRIIELASGSNFQPEVEVEKMPAIPALMYPKTAGELYAKYILKGLE